MQFLSSAPPSSDPKRDLGSRSVKRLRPKGRIDWNSAEIEAGKNQRTSARYTATVSIPGQCRLGHATEAFYADDDDEMTAVSGLRIPVRFGSNSA